jgi:soluble lytic murein transglycosylase-like protein
VAATRYGVEPLLLFSVMSQESAFNSQAVSPKGARGLMQLMPETAARFGVKNIFDPEQNIHAGAQYLRFLLDLFDGNVSLALAGYNAGEGAVKKYGYVVPPYPETINYVRKIKRRYTNLSTLSK